MPATNAARQSIQKLCANMAAAANAPPIMPHRQPTMNPARRPCRFMNSEIGIVVSPPPMMQAVAGIVTSILFVASVSAASVPMEIIVALFMTSKAWHAASATTFLRSLFMLEGGPALLEPDVDAVEYVLPGIDELRGLGLLAPFESRRLQVDAFAVQRDAAAGDGNQHAAGCVEFGALARMQDDARHEHAFVVDQQSLVRAFRDRIRFPAPAEDLGVDDAISRGAGIADAVGLRLGAVVDVIGFADGALAAPHRFLAQVLCDGRGRGDVDEYPVAAMPVIARFVPRFEFDIEEAHVLVLECEPVARLLFDGNGFIGGGHRRQAR